MDLLDNYVNENALSKENILKYIDQYSIYSFYIGEELELNTKYSSPLRRGDLDPSFALFFSKKDKKTIMFKDHGTGLSGDVFLFLSKFLNLPFRQVLLQIDYDFNLGFNKEKRENFVPVISKEVKVKKELQEILITSKPYSKPFLNFWEKYGITEEVLQLYYVKDVDIVHYVRKDNYITIAPKELTIAYEILGTYKIYQPFSTTHKFTNNYVNGYVEGALQLTWDKSFVIITKSTKECMFFRSHFNWDACSGTSENTIISEYFMSKLLKKYPKVLIWLDNDEPGQRALANYVKLYPTLIPIVHKSIHKDPTDMYDYASDKSEALSYINTLIHKHLNHNE